MNWCVMTKDSLVSSKGNVDIGKERKEFKSVRIGFVHQYVHHLIGLVTNQGAKMSCENDLLGNSNGFSTNA